VTGAVDALFLAGNAAVATVVRVGLRINTRFAAAHHSGSTRPAVRHPHTGIGALPVDALLRAGARVATRPAIFNVRQRVDAMPITTDLAAPAVQGLADSVDALLAVATCRVTGATVLVVRVDVDALTITEGIAARAFALTRGRIEDLRGGALIADAVVVATGRIVGADRDAFTERAHFAARTGMAATATIFVVALGIDALTVAVSLGFTTGALPVVADFAWRARMAAGTTVLGIDLNDGAATTTTYVASQTAVPGSAVLDLRVIALLCHALAAETCAHPAFKKIRSSAQPTACSRLDINQVVERIALALSHVAAGRGGVWCAE